jgi:hypothetical protein
LLKKAERDEVPEPKTKGENKDSTYLSPAAAGHRLSPESRPSAYRRTHKVAKEPQNFTLNALIAARQFKCT